MAESAADRQLQANAELENFARLLYEADCHGLGIRPHRWSELPPWVHESLLSEARFLIGKGVKPPSVERGESPLVGQLEIER